MLGREMDETNTMNMTIPLLSLHISGVGVVGGFGVGMGALRQALEHGPPALARASASSAPDGETIAAYLADVSRLADFAPKRSLRRLDHYSRLALLGAYLALEDAGVKSADEVCPVDRLAVITASGYGASATTFAFLDSVLDDGDRFASPTHFSHSVHNAAAANVAIRMGITGPNLTVSQFALSTCSALLTAQQWLSSGRVDAVLFGGVDQYCDVLGYCWRRFFNAPGDAPAPFEFDRQSAVPGEGAAFFLLTPGTLQDTAAYAVIREVLLDAPAQVFQAPQARAQTPAPRRLLLGLDGHTSCAAHYEPWLKNHPDAEAYAAYYGSLPTAQGLDLAIAADLVRRDARTTQLVKIEAEACGAVTLQAP